MLYENRVRAGSFGEDAEQYDRARPSYPAALIDALVATRPHKVLDVGCGTGKAGRLLAQRGCDVLGVELDPRMAAVARRHGLTVEEAMFEQWDAHGRLFDLVVSAQAWHWVDPVAGPAKAASVLRPGGQIGLFWNVARPDEALAVPLAEVYRRHAPEMAGQSVLFGDASARAGAASTSLGAAPQFGEVEVRTFPNDLEYTTEQWLDNIATHSDHRTLPVDRLRSILDDVAKVIDSHGGRILVRYETFLVQATKTA